MRVAMLLRVEEGHQAKSALVLRLSSYPLEVYNGFDDMLYRRQCIAKN